MQPVQLVEGIRGVVALEKTTESLLTDLKNQDFTLTDEEINQLRQTVKGQSKAFLLSRLLHLILWIVSLSLRRKHTYQLFSYILRLLYGF